jgi:membrane-associated phospholipid phosphatase
MQNMVNRRQIVPSSIAILLALAVAATALFLFGWLAEEVHENEAIRFDNTVRTALHGFASPGLTVFLKWVSNLNGPVALLIYTLVAVGLFWWKSHRTSAALVAVTMAGGVCLDGVLKLAFHRARPAPYFGLPTPGTFSFPSGHSLMSLCFYGVVAYLVSVHVESPAWRLTLRVSGALIVLLVGASRIYLGVHYPSDVAAGFAAGLVWLTAIVFAYRRIARPVA